MRFLVLGALGMLGSDLFAEAERRGHLVTGFDLAELDITDPVQVARIGARQVGDFDWIFNCAAYTAVDKAETEVRAATELNAIAPGFFPSRMTEKVLADIQPMIEADVPMGRVGAEGELKGVAVFLAAPISRKDLAIEVL